MVVNKNWNREGEGEEEQGQEKGVWAVWSSKGKEKGLTWIASPPPFPPPAEEA
jgi:hypothetical protein